MTRDDGLAPVIPLFGGPAPAAPAAQRDVADAGHDWHQTWTATPDEAVVVGLAPDEDEARAAAEKHLLKKLRVRSLSERETRSFLREQGLAPHIAESLVDSMLGHGYLDDARLAEQLIHAGTTRKGQGRQALSLALGQRGIPRDVADAALAELEDDDAERALEFARQKARSMRELDRDAALRRLAGQLSRRGYGALAFSAARQALDELDRPPLRGVRFE